MSIGKVTSTATFALVVSGVRTLTMADEVKRIPVNGYGLLTSKLAAPVIFVHGDLQDYRMWGERLPKFAARYRAIAYSRRNN